MADRKTLDKDKNDGVFSVFGEVSGGGSGEPAEGTVCRCPRCSEVVTPEVMRMPTMKTHILVGVLGLIGVVGLMFIPYLLGLFSKPVKRCPYCGDILRYEV